MKYLYEMKYIFLALFVVVIVFYLVFNAEFIFKSAKSIQSKVERKEILNVRTYYAEYLAQINSNKTNNTYNIIEWYKGKNMQKTRYIDKDNSIIEYILRNGELKVKSSTQTLEYILDANTFSLSKNELSLIDFIEMYKEKIGKNYTYNEKNKLVFEIVLNSKNWYNGKISRRILVVDTTTQKPITLTNLDNNKKVVSKVEFKVFEFNKEIEDNIFEIK